MMVRKDGGWPRHPNRCSALCLLLGIQGGRATVKNQAGIQRVMKHGYAPGQGGHSYPTCHLRALGSGCARHAAHTSHPTSRKEYPTAEMLVHARNRHDATAIKPVLMLAGE